MNLTAIQPQTRGAHLSLERLQQNPNVPEREKLAEAGRQFEAVLLRKILAEVYKPMVQSKYNTSSLQSSIYQDMITSQMAESLSRSGSFGLARQLEQQLGRQLQPAAPSPTKPH